ncbi:focadhesin isoform X2 [Denticeps clupeoides]|uniref:focadhesin isoform X2 n=1 Tax=Denticeps clupeoides TaxID=299321 RepID=UPI0010A3A81A|nr:focadhesin isoform X2 [Denticeps clupeoides]
MTMNESLKSRLEFPSYLIQAQAVRSLVAAVLKEKSQSGKICQTSIQGPALESLWVQCCSDSALVRSACCDSLVLLVEQGHADLQYILNTILNVLPSARNVQGLITVVGKLLQIQASEKEEGAYFTCPYSIRNNPHPYITVLENRPDCWPSLLQEIDAFIKRASDRNDPECVPMLLPFLRYLFCEPQRLSDYTLLRQGLLRALLSMPSTPALSLGMQAPSPEVTHCLVQCLLNLIPHMQVDSITAVLEVGAIVEVLWPVMAQDSQRWQRELSHLVLQLLCACHLSLEFGGEIRPLLHTMTAILPSCAGELPLEKVMMGVSLLLLRASVPQQSSLLELATRLMPDQLNPPWGAPLLLLPLLQVLTCSNLMEALTDPNTRESNQSLAQTLIKVAQHGANCSPTEADIGEFMPLSTWYSELQVGCSVLRHMAGNTEATISNERDICQLAFDTTAAIAQADPTKVPCLLSVLMFKLGQVSDPALCQSILYTLPKLGTHKFCVPQVLQVLHTLGSAAKLRGVVLRLVTILWEKQDRVYPELQKLMALVERGTVVMGKESQWELVLARAACVRDICKERPYQHGGDMLAAITNTITQCTRKDQATPAALALQGLQELCRAEVVDIGSTWKALSPMLSCDSRPIVLKAIAGLLSLVPQLAVKTDDYEKLKEQVVTILWSYTLSQDPEVASSGYRALSEFPETSHVIMHLPEQARPVVMHPESEDEDLKDNENEEIVSVPGPSYIKLIGLTQQAVLPALEGFLTAMVRQEMSEMPRGVYHSALRRGNLRTDQGKTVAGIPAFMHKTYEKNKQPGLKPGLAVGLLLCYDLPIQTDKEGQPIRRFLVSRGRSYQQMLAALIQEVNIQPSEWHRSMLLPHAWRGFMSRTFHAALQGYRAELEMQWKQSKEKPDELQYQQHCAWLWVRDQLTDVIKSAAKESPVVQGNSILALSGLAAVLIKYESNMPSDSKDGPTAGPEILPTGHWLNMVIDTLVSIVSSTYRPKGLVFPWFQHRSYSGENTASAIARSCAALGLSLLVPVLVTSHHDSLADILSILQVGLPGSASADESQAVQFHTGLALGMFLFALHDERISEISGQSMAGLLKHSLDSLENCCFDSSLEYNAGCVLGVALVLAWLARNGRTEQQTQVGHTLDRLLTKLQDSSSLGRMLQEVLAYSVACVGVSGFSSGLVSADKAEEIMITIRSMTEESQQTPGLALALGLAVHGLSSYGHGKADDLYPRLLPAWTKILLAEGSPTMQRLAALNGLVALAGSEVALIQLKSESELSSQQQNRLNEVIRAITQVISFSGAIGLQSNGACLLGHLHLAHMSFSDGRTAVPQDFGYLPEKSLIRATVDFITEAGKKGPEFTSPELAKVALASLAFVGRSFQYPPVNWSAVLSPLMKLNFGAEVQHHCIELAAMQAQSSQSASLFLGVWLVPPLVHTLSLRTRRLLFEVLGSWMKHVTDDKLQAYVETLGVQQFAPDTLPQRLLLCHSILKGLASAMALPNPAQTCWVVLCATTEKIYNLLPGLLQDTDMDLYEGIAKCLSEMSDTEIDRICKVTEVNLEKAGFILAYLSSQGRVPLLGLNDVITVALQHPSKEGMGWILHQCLYQSRLTLNPYTGVSKRMEWLLELMGHIRNVAYRATTVMSPSVREATEFLFGVFSAALVSWSDHATPLILGVRAQWFPWKQCTKKPRFSHALYGTSHRVKHGLSQCLLAVPPCLNLLLAKEPWKSQSQKFIDWLFSIAEGPTENLSNSTIFTAKASLLALRFTPEFKKKAVWTRAYGW